MVLIWIGAETAMTEEAIRIIAELMILETLIANFIIVHSVVDSMTIGDTIIHRLASLTIIQKMTNYLILSKEG